jgi:hypothetical protein
METFLATEVIWAALAMYGVEEMKPVCNGIRATMAG